jgi:hypothetical protein
MGMSDSPLTRADLDALHIPVGEVFGRIFKHTRGMTREEALVVAQQIHLGTWVPPQREDRKMKPGSVWEFFATKFPFLPSMAAPNPMWASKSEARRMIEQGAIRLNWHTDWKADDDMPPILELTLFPGGHRITSLWCASCEQKSSACAGHLDEWIKALERGKEIIKKSRMTGV